MMNRFVFLRKLNSFIKSSIPAWSNEASKISSSINRFLSSAEKLLVATFIGYLVLFSRIYFKEALLLHLKSSETHRKSLEMNRKSCKNVENVIRNTLRTHSKSMENL